MEDKDMQKLFGTVVPIVTPLTDEDAVDEGSLRNLVDHVIANSQSPVYPVKLRQRMRRRKR